MIIHSKSHSLPVALLIAVLFSCSTGYATDYTWDTVPGNGSQVGDSAAGTWDTTTTNWSNDGGSTNVAWSNGGLDSAFFDRGPYTVTLGDNVTAGLIDRLSGSGGASPMVTIDPDGGNLYSIILDPATKSGSYQITIEGTRPLTINAPIVLTGYTQQFRDDLIINGVISGGNALSYYASSGFLTLTGNNTFTGGFTLFSGESLVLGHDNALGTGAVDLNDTTTLTATNGARTFANDFSLANWNEARTVAGANNITFTGPYRVMSYNGANEFATLEVQEAACTVTFHDFQTHTSGVHGGFKKLGAGTVVLADTYSNISGSDMHLTVDGGTLLFNTAATTGNINVSAGTLGGNGAITLASASHITVSANVQPGSLGSGNLSISGGNVAFSSGNLIIDIDGSSAGELAVDGDVSLDGGLMVNTLTPASYNTRRIISATSISGNLSAPIGWKLEYRENNTQLWLRKVHGAIIIIY